MSMVYVQNKQLLKSTLPGMTAMGPVHVEDTPLFCRSFDWPSNYDLIYEICRITDLWKGEAPISCGLKRCVVSLLPTSTSRIFPLS